MQEKFKNDFRQAAIMIAIVLVGAVMTWVMTSKAIKTTQQAAAKDFQYRASFHLARVSQIIFRGNKAASYAYTIYEKFGKANNITYADIIRDSTYLSQNRLFVGLVFPSYDAASAIKTDSFSSVGDTAHFKLSSVWSKDAAYAKQLEGYDLGNDESLYSFFLGALEVKEPSLLLLPDLPIFKSGHQGRLLITIPIKDEKQTPGLIVQVLDLQSALILMGEQEGFEPDGLYFEVSCQWADGKYSTTYGSSTMLRGGERPREEDYGTFDNSVQALSLQFERKIGHVNWRFSISALPGSVNIDYDTAAATAIFCIILTGLFFTIFYLQSQRTRRTAEIVDRRTRALKEAHAELEEHYRLLQNLNIDVEEARKSAEQANTAKSEFLATMSHELRTPLNAILGFSQLLIDQSLGAIGDKRYIEYAKDISSSGTHLLALINDILDLAKLEAGKVVIDRRPVIVEAIVDRVHNLIKQQAEMKGIYLSIEISPDMPEYILGDELRLRQLLINLCTNAVKFTNLGDITIRVHPKPLPGGGAGWVMEVEDTGIGIALDKQSTLFDRFTQVDTALTRRHGGTGLGLAICRELVERMEGTISVLSAVGVGTTVTIHLPLESADTDDIEDDGMII